MFWTTKLIAKVGANRLNALNTSANFVPTFQTTEGAVEFAVRRSITSSTFQSNC
ncbi:MAG: hypothetical protein ACTS6P_00935 [Candidatus Hodgkinia cicadicola]